MIPGNTLQRVWARYEPVSSYMRLQFALPRSHVDDTNIIINDNKRFSRKAKRAIQRGEEENKEQRILSRITSVHLDIYPT